MERILLDVFLFNLHGFDRVNILELVETQGYYCIYENYGNRKDPELHSALVHSYGSLDEAVSAFDRLSAAMQNLGFNPLENGATLDLPGFHSIASECRQPYTMPTKNTENQYRLLDF